MDIVQLTEKKEKFIENKLREPNDYRIRYVAFIDLLGFKNITYKKNCAEIKALFNDLELIKYSFDNFFGKYTFGVDLIEDIDFTIMSDGIVISSANNIEGLAYLLFLCAKIQFSLFAHSGQMILLRGGICNGKYYTLNNLSFGPALTEAYRLESTESIMPRIILHPNIIEKLKSNGIIRKEDMHKSFSKFEYSSVSSIINLFLARPFDDQYFFVNYLNTLELLSLYLNYNHGNDLIKKIQTSLLEGLKHTDTKVQKNTSGF